jgi:hypothetical protein
LIENGQKSSGVVRDQVYPFLLDLAGRVIPNPGVIFIMSELELAQKRIMVLPGFFNRFFKKAFRLRDPGWVDSSRGDRDISSRVDIQQSSGSIALDGFIFLI